MVNQLKFDVFGDIHGYADQLAQLLEKLRYSKRNGTYRHPDPKRKAIFVGDFKLVRDRHSFHPRSDINHAVLIDALKNETKLKTDLSWSKRIGF